MGECMNDPFRKSSITDFGHRALPPLVRPVLRVRGRLEREADARRRMLQRRRRRGHRARHAHGAWRKVKRTPCK
jgi:hypothetical protein